MLNVRSILNNSKNSLKELYPHNWIFGRSTICCKDKHFLGCVCRVCEALTGVNLPFNWILADLLQVVQGNRMTLMLFANLVSHTDVVWKFFMLLNLMLFFCYQWLAFLFVCLFVSETGPLVFFSVFFIFSVAIHQFTPNCYSLINPLLCMDSFHGGSC